MLRPGFPRLSHPEVAHAIPSVGFMAQVYRRVRLLVSPTIVGVQLTDQQRTAQAPAQAVSVIQPDGVADDVRRQAMPKVAGSSNVHPGIVPRGELT